jgi:UDP-GlcNAc:undecaprenyl-phosphate GlcNAc-1-phosphate transferase
VLAFLIGLLVTPMVKRGAISIGLIDRPDAFRKIHSRAIAYGGGLAVFLTLLISLGWFAVLSDTWFSRATERTTEFLGLAVAAALICVIGLWDDYYGLGGKKKLLGQAVAGCVVLYTGPAVQDISLFGWTLHLGLFVYPVLLMWILFAINSVNLIDGMDGLASSVAISMSASLAIVGLWNGHPAEALVALALAGSLFSFLVYNFFPASIFLGDAGSMLIGLLIGSLLLWSTVTPSGDVPILISMAVMTIPLFDTSAAIIRRKFTGRSIYTVDRGHIHHCFRRNGMNVRTTMSCIALLSVVAGLGAIASVVVGGDIFALLGMISVIGVLAMTKSFGHSELLLLFRHAQAFLLSFVRSSDKHDVRIQLQGERNWEGLWDELKTTAQRLALSRVRLDVNLPAKHEGYYAEWKSRAKKSDEAPWLTVLPLIGHNGRSIGRVELAGDRSEIPSFPVWLSKIGELLEQVELRVAVLAEQHTSPTAETPVVLHLSDAANGHAPKMPGKLMGNGTEPVSQAH